MNLSDGFLFGYLRRQAIEERKAEKNDIERLTAQRDALHEVIKVLVPEDDVRESHVTPLYRRILREEYSKRRLPLPQWLKA
jgi:hypothetical protein